LGSSGNHMPRTTAQLVRELLGDDYGPRYNGSLPSLQPFVDSATLLVDRVVNRAVNKGILLPTDHQELIERWLAAHMYCQNDPQYMSKNTGSSGGSFMRPSPGEGLDSTTYGQTAQRLDYSGCLRNLDKQQTAGGAWLGKTASEQTTWEQRN
jgi:hypothetical protein